MFLYLTSVDDWATVQISTPPDDSAIVGRELVMTCTVTAVRGLTVIPVVTWTGPDGNLTYTEDITVGFEETSGANGDLTDSEKITVGDAQTSGLVTTRSLTFHSLQSSEGGRYSCMAAVDIPRLETRSASKPLNVIST